MPAPQIDNVENVLESWIGDMAKFVVKKQVKELNIDAEKPSKPSLEKLIRLIEKRCLVKMMDPVKVVEVRKELQQAIKTEGPLENETTLMLNRRMRTFLRKKFGDVAVHTLNMEKKKLGLNDIKDPKEYVKLAEEVRVILSAMVDEDMAQEIYNGMVEIIYETEKGD